MSRFKRILTVSILVIILGLIPIVYQRWTVIESLYLEQDSPEVLVIRKPEGIGVKPSPVTIRVKDLGAGIDEVIVRAIQKDRKIELSKTKLSGGFFDFILVDGPLDRTRDRIVQFALPTKEQGIRTGAVTIEVVAFDRAVWSNRAELNFEMTADFTRPKIQALTPNQNIFRTGLEMVFYSVSGKESLFSGESGVLFRDQRFNGYQAALLDPAFEVRKDIYVSLFPLPDAFDEEQDRLQLFAEDVVGNFAKTSFVYNLLEVNHRTSSLTVNFTDEELLVYKQGKELARTRDEPMLVALLSKLAKMPEPRRFTGTFSQFNARQIGIYGDKRRLVQDKNTVFEEFLQTSEYAVPSEFIVQAPNAGKVRFVGDLATRGLSVIVDHGLGLISLYTHLSSTSVSEGQLIETGQPLGLAGQSGIIELGLREPARFGFELRLHGVPIRPTEFWDKQWQQEHIEKEVLFMKRNLGLLTEEEMLEDRKKRKNKPR